MIKAGRALAALTALGIVMLLATGVQAHGPPAKRPQDVRLLADHNDDCGGDDAGQMDRCNGSHDLVGLDLHEAHDDALGDIVIFRFILNGGVAADGLRDVLVVQAGEARMTFELATTDNQAFTGTGFDAVAPAEPARNGDGSADGTRILVQATVRLATLGGAGTRLTDYQVASFRGDEPGDYMPGGSVDATGTDHPDPPQGDQATNFERTLGYVLQGPRPTATSTSPASDGPRDAAAGGLLPAGAALAATGWRRRTT